MAENPLGYLNNAVVAERLGRALAEAALAEELDGAEHRRRDRQRKRRARVTETMRALAMRRAPADAEPSLARHPLPAEH